MMAIPILDGSVTAEDIEAVLAAQPKSRRQRYETTLHAPATVAGRPLALSRPMYIVWWCAFVFAGMCVIVLGGHRLGAGIDAMLVSLVGLMWGAVTIGLLCARRYNLALIVLFACGPALGLVWFAGYL